MENRGGAAPTGCYKCGRPGHWSRDCPSSTTTTPAAANSNSAAARSPTTTNTNTASTGTDSAAPAPKPKRAARTRPKLTADLLLSDDGLGHILKYFPRAFKCRGRGREVEDLGHLLGLYADWHSRLLPYYPFDQFVQKVEQVGTSKRVKLCIRELRDKVADGVDPTKLHESQVQEIPTNEQDAQDGIADPIPLHENAQQNQDRTPLHENAQQDLDTDNFEEDMLHRILEKDTEEPYQPSDVRNDAADVSGDKDVPDQTSGKGDTSSNQPQMSDGQKARMEANRLKALERAAARSRTSRPT